MADIHSFESFAALDGDGIRYMVFFTGCPLRCVYCHNPDTWHKSGREMNARDVANKAKRYKPYFKDGGGVTFSGGEPLLNAAFINETAALLHEEGIGYELDTSGSVPLTEAVKQAVDGADMVMLDLKFYCDEDYQKYTGGGMKNVIALGDYCTQTGKRLSLRTVVVPGINDSEEHIRRYRAFASRFHYEKYELLAFHTMGFFKYEKLGLDNPLKDVKPLPDERLKALQSIMDQPNQ